MNLKHPIVLKDSLYNCSTDCTKTGTFESVAGLNPAQCYGQGIVLGMVSAFMAQDMVFQQALDIVKNHLPETFDMNCMPPSWREL